MNSLQDLKTRIERIERLSLLADKAKAIAHYYEYDRVDLDKRHYHYTKYLNLMGVRYGEKVKLMELYYSEYDFRLTEYVPQDFNYGAWLSKQNTVESFRDRFRKRKGYFYDHSKDEKYVPVNNRQSGLLPNF